MTKLQLQHACLVLAAVTVFTTKLLWWLLLGAGLLFILNPETASGKLAVLIDALQTRPRQETARTTDGKDQGSTATKTKTSSVSFQSISPRLSVRGIELRRSDGVIVRIGKVSFGFRRLKQMIRRQPLQKGKGKAIVVTVENAKVLLPDSFLERSSTANVTPSGGKGFSKSKGLEKAIPLPAVAQLFARFVAIEICDLRIEIAASKKADNSSSSSNGAAYFSGHGRALGGSGGADAAPAPPAAAGLRAIELVGVRLVGFVSRGSSCLTVGIEVMCSRRIDCWVPTQQRTAERATRIVLASRHYQTSWKSPLCGITAYLSAARCCRHICHSLLYPQSRLMEGRKRLACFCRY